MNTSTNSGGPYSFLAGEKVPVGVALVADAAQLVAVLAEAPEGVRIGLFAAALAVTFLFVLFYGARWKQIGIALYLALGGILVAAAILFFWPASWHIRLDRGAEELPPSYFITVSVFSYGRDGTNVDQPLPGVEITVRDEHNHISTSHTSAKGMRTLPLETYGPMQIGACGVFQTHFIKKANNTPGNAYPVQVAISPPLVDSCR